LLRKRKFHIRAYVLAVSALRVYFYRNCLALCAGKKYSDNNHYTDLSAHITNTAYQIESDKSFQDKFCVLQWSESVIAPILVRDGTCTSISHARECIHSTIDKMGAITGELFRAYKGEFGVFSPLENCFEHYGLDFLVDDEWNVYLLEVNPGPDFKQTGNKLEKLIEDLMGATIDVALFPLVCGCGGESFNGEGDDACPLRLVYEQCRATSLQG
jgi:tubulin---tyrosine ligase